MKIKFQAVDSIADFLRGLGQNQCWGFASKTPKNSAGLLLSTKTLKNAKK